MATRISKLSASAVVVFVVALAGANAAANDDIDLAAFDLEDLISMEVTSVSKKSERAFEAPAAAFVITSEDIRRSGARTIAEVLRMVPGVQVAQLAHSQYAITVRGFNGNFSDKLLVLMDGRSVYTPLFAGVFWDIQDTPLHDIDRIEVIRGPGGTVWGANAVNGVINIVTKHTSKTQGWHVEAGAGDYERPGSGSIRYGGKFGDNVHFRAYLKHFDREELKSRDGMDPDDAYDELRTGFRLDAQIGESGEFTLQGDLYETDVSAVVAGESSQSEIGGGNVLSRYTHNFSDTHNASIQFYYDRRDRNANILLYELDTIDIELKHQIEPIEGLSFVWGGEYRYRHDDSKTRNPDPFDPALPALGLPEALTLEPSERKLDLFSGFVQAEGRLFDEQIRVTVGTKLEDNDTSGFEVQPSGRIAYVPNDSMTFWASVSRAVRTPSRANDDVGTIGTTDAGTPFQTNGTRDVEAEDLMAYEAGFRIQPTDWLHIDLAGYYNDYDDLIVEDVDLGSLRLIDLDGPGPLPAIAVFDSFTSNDADGYAWGIELFARAQLLEDYSVVKKWWIDATYSYIDVDVDRDSGNGIDDLLGGALGEDQVHQTAKSKSEAHHTIGLRSHWDLDCDLEFDLAYSYVGKVSEVGGDEIDAYHKVDIRTAWHPTENVELSFTVDNLLDGEHKEWNAELFIAGSKIPRTFYGKVALDF